jgi:hypothetical protein
LGGRFSGGSGTPLDAGTYAGSTDDTSTLRSTDFNLYREFEYLTATRITTQAGFKFSRLLKQSKIRAFANIDYERTKAADVEFMNGDTFNSVSLSVGCSF